MINRGHALVPRKLDMSQFGNKSDKVALILDRMYRAKMYKNDYGFADERHKFTEDVTINMEHLVKILRESATPILDMICHSKRHVQTGTQPIVTVLVRVKPAIKGKRSAQYVLAEPYRDKPTIYRLQRINPVFKHDKEATETMIAGWSENYQTVCRHVKALSLEMDEEQCEELIQRTRNKYIQDGRTRYIKNKACQLMAQYPKWSEDTARIRATASWEKHREKRIAKLDEKNYDRLLFIMDKVLEMGGKDEMPIYALDPQGRLHYYLTNMPEELRPYIRLDGCKMVAYDIGTSQCVFVWIAIREYIRKNSITLNDVKLQADEIMETIKQCSSGAMPDYVVEGLNALKRKRNPQALDEEMSELGNLLGKDFYADIMQTIDWQSDRKQFKSKIWFPFLYGKMPSWNAKTERKTMMHYFLQKFPAIYCVLWRMRQFTEICLNYHEMVKNGIQYPAIEKHIDEIYSPAEFPKEMQRQEANMLYNVIIPQIQQPLVTIHDSIIVQAGKSNNVAEIMKQAFMQIYQLNVRISCENW